MDAATLSQINVAVLEFAQVEKKKKHKKKIKATSGQVDGEEEQDEAEGGGVGGSGSGSGGVGGVGVGGGRVGGGKTKRRMDRLRRSFRESFRRRKDHVPESSKPHQWQSDEAAVRSGTCNFYVKVFITFFSFFLSFFLSLSLSLFWFCVSLFGRQDSLRSQKNRLQLVWGFIFGVDTKMEDWIRFENDEELLLIYLIIIGAAIDFMADEWTIPSGFIARSFPYFSPDPINEKKNPKQMIYIYIYLI